MSRRVRRANLYFEMIIMATVPSILGVKCGNRETIWDYSSKGASEIPLPGQHSRSTVVWRGVVNP
jgi:hypothetical protein